MSFIINEERVVGRECTYNWTVDGIFSGFHGAWDSTCKRANGDARKMSRCLDGLPRGGLISPRVALTALGLRLMRGNGKLEVRCGDRHGETVRRIRRMHRMRDG